MVENIIVNIAFNITNPLHDEILEISQEIKEKYGSDWYMDDKKFLLHLPVFLMLMPGKNISKLKEVAASYVKAVERIPIKSKKLVVSGNLIFLEFDSSEILMDYHLLALKEFNPLREGCIRDKYKDENYLNTLTENDRSKVEKYGYTHIQENFKPHITLARIEDKVVQDEIMRDYKPRLISKMSELDRFQIHHAMFEPENKDILLVDIKI